MKQHIQHKAKGKTKNKMGAAILLLLTLPIFLFLYYYKKHQNATKNKLKPPGPPGLPLIGNLLQFEAKDTHMYLRRLSRKYGPVLQLKLGNRPVLVVSSPTIIQEIMKNHDLAFSSRPKMKGLYKLSYNGMDVGFCAYNDSWRELRKISTVHLFSHRQVQSFQPIRQEEVTRLIQRVAEDASASKVTNMSEMAISFTSNLICRIAFGKSYGEEGYEKARFYDLLRDAQAMLVAFYYSDYLPALGWIDKINGTDAKLEKIYKKLDSFYDELIEEHMNPNRPDSMKGDILDLLMELRKDKSTPMEVTWEHIKGLVMDVFSGGTDTSAAAIVWAMTALIKHPPLMKKAQAEIRSVIGDKGMIEEEDFARLPYLRAVTKETFRLFPSTPLLALRETLQNCVVGGYEVEAGMTVYINAWAVARDPDTWKDPEEFMPERFMGSDLDVRGFHPEVIPFGIGRRKCPGIPMAMASVELALANLLYTFDWALPAGVKEEDIDYEVIPGVTMHKKNPLFLIPTSVCG